MAAVAFACAPQPQVVPLTHVVLKVHGFLFSDDVWTLESTSQHGLLRLLERLLNREWPGSNVLRRERRLSNAIAKGYDVPALHWWLKRYMPSQTVVSMHLVSSLAIKNGRLPVVQWLV